jgi:hypothetical protein
MKESAIVIQNLVKKFEDVTAVDGISLQVAKGELFGLLRALVYRGLSESSIRPISAEKSWLNQYVFISFQPVFHSSAFNVGTRARE